jgi:hypothetical protein
MIRNFMLAASVLALGASAGQARPEPTTSTAVTPSPAKIGDMAARAYLARPDIVPLRTSQALGVHYADVASGYGAARLAAATGDKALLDRVIAREKVASAFENSANHVDVSVYGTWPLEIARQTGDKDALRRGVALADNQWAKLGDDGLTTQARYWIDDVWMIGSLQVQAHRASKDSKYLDRAALMARRYVERLQQPNGLFFHGDAAHFYWGRGNGWVAAGFAEILTDLPSTHPERPAIEAGYRVARQSGQGRHVASADRPSRELEGKFGHGDVRLRDGTRGAARHPRRSGLSPRV